MNDKPFLIFPDTNTEIGGDRHRAGYIPGPSSYSVQMSDVDLDDKRSTSAYLTRNRIRQNVYSISCGWSRVSDSQLQRILLACQAAKFKLTFRDPLNTTSRFTTKNEMYADANKTVTLIHTEDEDNDYWSVELTFVEY